MHTRHNTKQMKQLKITNFVQPLLTPSDIEWKKQHAAKVQSGKKVRGTDPVYQHMPSYPVTLSSKQADVKQLYDARNGSKLAMEELPPVMFMIHKKRNRMS